MAMDFNFKDSPRKNRRLKYLRFLPKNLRKNAFQALIINIATIALSVISYSGLQREIPLFYSLPSSQHLIAKEAIFILPAIATTINFLHFLIIKGFKNAHKTILRLFMLITELLQLIIFAILLRLVLILN